MGREIRRVPHDWEHPRNEQGHFSALYDNDIESARQEWADGFLLWVKKEHPYQSGERKATCKYYWEYFGDPPDEERYRKRAWTVEQATHYQMYENVSEGSPVSPIFASLDELESWLVGEGYSPEGAKAFCKGGHAPSMMIMPGKGIVKGIDAIGILAEEKKGDE